MFQCKGHEIHMRPQLALWINAHGIQENYYWGSLEVAIGIQTSWDRSFYHSIIRLGQTSLGALLSSHLSSQNRIVLPSLRILLAPWKKACQQSRMLFQKNGFLIRECEKEVMVGQSNNRWNRSLETNMRYYSSRLPSPFSKKGVIEILQV